MLFCNLTPLDGRFVNAIVFCQKSEFSEYITSLHIQHSIYVRQFEFFVFTMKQIASIFCNVSLAGQYRYLRLFYSKHESLTYVVRNVILDVLTHSFSTNYGFLIKMLMLTHQHHQLRGGSIYKITYLQKVHYFFI